MTIQEIRPTLVRVFADYCVGASADLQDVKDTDKLDDLGVDSLELIERTMAVEDKFNIEISDEELDTLQTFGDFLAMVTKLLNPHT